VPLVCTLRDGWRAAWSPARSLGVGPVLHGAEVAAHDLVQRVRPERTLHAAGLARQAELVAAEVPEHEQVVAQVEVADDAVDAVRLQVTPPPAERQAQAGAGLLAELVGAVLQLVVLARAEHRDRAVRVVVREEEDAVAVILLGRHQAKSAPESDRVFGLVVVLLPHDFLPAEVRAAGRPDALDMAGQPLDGAARPLGEEPVPQALAPLHVQVPQAAPGVHEVRDEAALAHREDEAPVRQGAPAELCVAVAVAAGAPLGEAAQQLASPCRLVSPDPPEHPRLADPPRTVTLPAQASAEKCPRRRETPGRWNARSAQRLLVVRGRVAASALLRGFSGGRLAGRLAEPRIRHEVVGVIAFVHCFPPTREVTRVHALVIHGVFQYTAPIADESLFAHPESRSSAKCPILEGPIDGSLRPEQRSGWSTGRRLGGPRGAARRVASAQSGLRDHV
jgi:hypothetical protein